MDFKKKEKGGSFEKNSKIIKKEKKLTKKLVEYRFEKFENMLDLLKGGSYVFYRSQGMVAESSIGSIEFKYQFESDNGTIILYFYKFKKNIETKDLCSDDIILKYMEKYPQINFVQGSITIR